MPSPCDRQCLSSFVIRRSTNEADVDHFAHERAFAVVELGHRSGDFVVLGVCEPKGFAFRKIREVPCERGVLFDDNRRGSLCDGDTGEARQPQPDRDENQQPCHLPSPCCHYWSSFHLDYSFLIELWLQPMAAVSAAQRSALGPELASSSMLLSEKTIRSLPDSTYALPLPWTAKTRPVKAIVALPSG
jgi:hypothetical protein